MFSVSKISKNLLAAVFVVCLLFGCGRRASDEFDANQEIGVISREEGSGTRSAFIELFGIEQINESGDMIDHTTLSAVITNNTAVMMTTIAADRYAIGYISLGSLDDSVRALVIDGVEASAENIKNGSYRAARSLSIVVKSNMSAAANDFIDFMMSADGKSVIELAGYAAASDAPAYTGGVGKGKIVISGSSSVAPVMEKLKEAYIARNPGVAVELQQSDSSTGAADAADGTCDIGMISRSLTASEKEKGLISKTIAYDGIAVIVNKKNTVSALTSEQVMRIFSGEVTKWSGIE